MESHHFGYFTLSRNAMIRAAGQPLDPKTGVGERAEQAHNPALTIKGI